MVQRGQRYLDKVKHFLKQSKNQYTEEHMSLILCMPCLTRDCDIQLCALEQASHLSD